MTVLRFDLTKNDGKFKILNATNGGPWHKRHANDQYRSNFEDYKKARIPYSRNHDSNFNSVYGAPFCHDISAIFPNFDADENDANSYDFACTDENILCTLEAGTKTFFRLGQSIEHQIKKHNTLPPKDFGKWARICEHVIRHYTEGWADGFKLDMPYWEIWNEPDLDEDDSNHKRCWGGTKAQFFDLYEITAKHLKSCFPHLKIGGPALAFRHDWAEDFLAQMQKHQVPIDFFSWHIYCITPSTLLWRAEEMKNLLIKYGYEKTETICNEWNYVKDWKEGFTQTLIDIGGVKGASFVASVICQAQKTDTIDMLMYYDTRPGVFCGAFDIYTCKPRKAYYPLYWYGKFYDMEKYVKCDTQVDDVYTLCGVDKDGKSLCIITYYLDEGVEQKTVKLDFGKSGAKYQVYAVDKDNDGQLIETPKDLTFDMKPNTILLVKEL
ncbi:MAG: hypothetical protein IKB98_07220 [Clostridia bacterium]|nr:hypothetical protein [Clostridia bacterium]